jgi:hypothetical protein
MLTHNSGYKQLTFTGTADTFVLGVPPRAALRRLVIKQTAGTLAGFTVNIYDCDPASTPNSDDADVHKLCAATTVAPSSDTCAMYSVWLPYHNQQHESETSLAPKSQIYITISGAHASSKTFHVGYTATVG